MSDGRVSSRAETTRARHGADFYRRIGQRSQQLRQMARASHPKAIETLRRRRAAREARGEAWRAVREAADAVRVLREELASRTQADLASHRSSRAGFAHYREQLRAELAVAEARLADVRARHRELLADLRADPDGDEPQSVTPAGLSPREQG